MEELEVIESRSAKELLDNNVPYSDMTEEEIAAVIEYKAEMKLLDTESMLRQQVVTEHAANSLNLLIATNTMLVQEHSKLTELLYRKPTVKRADANEQEE